MSAKRVQILYSVILLIFAGLIIRVAIIQFFSTRALTEAAFEQRLSNTRIEKLRGNILDRNGIPFTNREQSYTAFIKPSVMPDSESTREKACIALGIDPTLLSELSAKSKPFLIKTDKAGSEEVLKLDTEWISILKSLDRYDDNALARHVIGYLNNKDQVGQTGIEKKFENELRNHSVFEIGTVTDAVKKPIKGLGYRVKSLSEDKKLNVRLTLDYHIQKLVEDAMDRNGISGAVVVEDVVSGDILSIASRPDFDQNAVENYLESDGNELFNKATAAYNLGSVFKIIDAAAFFQNEESIFLLEGFNLQAPYGGYSYGNNYYSNYYGSNSFGVDYGALYADNSYAGAPNADAPNDDTPYTRKGFSDPEHYYCSGAVDIGSLVFRCSSYYEGGHGEINMERAFAVSCNSYFIELSRKTGY